MHLFRTLVCSQLLIAAASAEPGAAKAVKVDFRRDVLPVLSSHCFHCHGPDEGAREAKLRLDVREDALKERDGFRPIVPGEPAKSEVIARILSTDPDEVMPPKKHDNKPLKPEEVELLRKWIADGAEYAQHWAFVPPQRPAVPVLPAGAKARNPIDPFVVQKLADHGLAQAAEADRYTLFRRVALELTGLPPSTAEWAEFLKDTSPEAYEHAVDRLLAKPAYGEKWARMWLDIARYADSSGYGSDQFRLNIWPYRDWVISAFNRNVPYDQFTIEQLAGDLLPKATTEQITATAFHRNTMTQNEGGTDDEEYRVAAVKDRVGTTMQGWMGLTANCAQCHSHKFDPISQQEYYQLFAVFNQTEDADRGDESPKMPLMTKAEDEQRKKIQAELAALETKLKTPTPEFTAELQAWEGEQAKPVAWDKLTVLEAKTREGQLAGQPDGSLQAPAQLAEKEKYTVKVQGPLRGVTAFRLEVMPETDGGQIGRAGGNGVLTGFEAQVVRATAGPVRGRFVRIEHAPKTYLQLAEVQAFVGKDNVAVKGKATQSSTGFGGTAEKAIDGKTDPLFVNGSVSHNGENDPSPWWEVDLGSEQPIDKIVVWNRAEAGERLKGARVMLLDAARKPVFSQAVEEPKPSQEFDPSGGYGLKFAAASADYEQSGFGVAGAISLGDKTGWGFGGASNRTHFGVFELAKPLDLAADSVLVITLRQGYGTQHNLGRFRLSATTKAAPVRVLPEAISKTLALEPSERQPAQREALAAYFRPFSKSAAGVVKEIAAQQAALAKIKSVELPIMKELPANKRRKSHLFNKGNFLTPGQEVQAALPVAFGAVPEVKPGTSVDRLMLAQWITQPGNPLTARVAVNRFWAQIFGVGLVETEEDFGTQGQYPSHPELLDWLAVQFATPKAQGGLGWDMKALVRLIVTSQTYRQESKASEAARQKDARNIYLSHYPRRRLEAEAIRDQALALAGLLNPKVGGPSVYPPQPDGLWNVAFNGGQDGYPTSKGPDRYRRGLYTFWRRIAPNPTMTTFDAPSRETCTIRRVPTNTPLQAFVTLNDPVYVECAQALARRIQTEAKGDLDTKIKWALQLVLGRPPEAAQIASLHKLYDAELAEYKSNGNAAQKLAANSEMPLPAGADAAELAAWMVVSNVLLNLDGVLTKS